MKEQLISFETAKLAKEKGYKLDIWLNYIDPIINFPTQSLLQKWIKDVNKIHIEPIFQGWADLHHSYHCKVHFIKDGIWEYFLATKGKDNLIYEEALEIGLQEALKLIKS